MGNSAFYYYPEANRPLTKIDLGRKVTSVLDWQVKDEDVSQAMSGAQSRVVYTTMNRCRVRIELFGDFDKLVELETFMNYMRAGGYCSFTEDTDAVCAGYATIQPLKNATTARIQRNLFGGFEASYSPGAGEFVVLQGPSPRMLKEIAVLSSFASNVWTFSNGLERSWENESWVLIRDRRFWPFLRLDPAASSSPNLNPGQGRVTWNIELDLFEPPDVLDRLAFTPRQFPDTTEEATDFDFESTLRVQVDEASGEIRTPYGGRSSSGRAF